MINTLDPSNIFHRNVYCQVVDIKSIRLATFAKVYLLIPL